MGYKLNQGVFISEITEHLGLTYLGIDVFVTGASSLDTASVGDVFFSNDGLLDAQGSVAIIPTMEISEFGSNAVVFSDNPRLEFIRILDYLVTNIGFNTWDFPPVVHPTAVIGQNVVIENGCQVGANCVIEHNVVLHEGVRLGENCRIRSCSSIGGDGFGFERLSDNVSIRFPHLGGVKVGNDVEIGACTAVARGTLSDTIIEDGVKVDNLVHVAHNCRIRKGAFVIACAELSGGVTVGESAWVAPNSCTHQKITIGRNSIVGLGAVVTKDVPDSSVYAGNPAKKIRDV